MRKVELRVGSNTPSSQAGAPSLHPAAHKPAAAPAAGAASFNPKSLERIRELNSPAREALDFVLDFAAMAPDGPCRAEFFATAPRLAAPGLSEMHFEPDKIRRPRSIGLQIGKNCIAQNAGQNFVAFGRQVSAILLIKSL